MADVLPSLSRGPSRTAVVASASAIAAGSLALGFGGVGGLSAFPHGAASWVSVAASGGRVLLQRSAGLAHLPRGPISVVSPAEPFILKAVSEPERARATRCLGNAVYYEAATEPVAGQRAVAQVVLNRVRDPNFPKSICGVVYQGWERQTGCQFSFTCDGSLLRGAPDAALMANARRVAEEALAGTVAAEVGTATHYHADYVSPWWKTGVTRVAQVGAHIFYRWPGAAGALAAFSGRYQGGETRLSEAVLTGRAPRPIQTVAGPDPTVLALKRFVIADASAPGGVRTRVQATLLFSPSGPAAAPSAPGLSPTRPPPTPEQVREINAALAKRAADAVGPATTGGPAVPVAEKAAFAAKPAASDPPKPEIAESAAAVGAEPAGADL